MIPDNAIFIFRAGLMLFPIVCRSLTVPARMSHKLYLAICVARPVDVDIHVPRDDHRACCEGHAASTDRGHKTQAVRACAVQVVKLQALRRRTSSRARTRWCSPCPRPASRPPGARHRAARELASAVCSVSSLDRYVFSCAR